MQTFPIKHLPNEFKNLSKRSLTMIKWLYSKDTGVIYHLKMNKGYKLHKWSQGQKLHSHFSRCRNDFNKTLDLSYSFLSLSSPVSSHYSVVWARHQENSWPFTFCLLTNPIIPFCQYAGPDAIISPRAHFPASQVFIYFHLVFSPWRSTFLPN